MKKDNLATLLKEMRIPRADKLAAKMRQLDQRKTETIIHFDSSTATDSVMRLNMCMAEVSRKIHDPITALPNPDIRNGYMVKTGPMQLHEIRSLDNQRCFGTFVIHPTHIYLVLW